MIGRVSRRRVIGSDAAIGVITTASFALGLALIGIFGTASKSIDATLFGSILGISTAEVWTVVGVAVVAVAHRVLPLPRRCCSPRSIRRSPRSPA